MADKEAPTLQDFGVTEMQPFQPCASYNRQLHWLIWLDEDVSYVAERVHSGLELLRHPEDGRIIGFKILDPVELYRKAGLMAS